MLPRFLALLLLVAMVSSRSLTRRQEGQQNQTEVQSSTEQQGQQQNTIGRIPLLPVRFYPFSDTSDQGFNQGFTGGMDKSLQGVQRLAAQAALAAQRGVSTAQQAAQTAVEAAQVAAVGGLQSMELGATALGDLIKDTVSSIATFASVFTNLLAGLGSIVPRLPPAPAGR